MTTSKLRGDATAKEKCAQEATVWVELDEIFMSDSTWNKLMRRDFGQIKEMRDRFECGLEVVPVLLTPRIDGCYNLKDGRHRFIAAKLADQCIIEAMIC